jgi:large subunit ribosomal protein L4
MSSSRLPLLAFEKQLYAWVRSPHDGKPLKQLHLPTHPFGVPLRPDLIQRVVVWYRAGLRAGTASTKDRSQVMGSTRKLRPNNNLGKARVGSIRSPIRRGGGICHGPKPRSWAFPIPSPILSMAMQSAFAAKYQQHELLILPNDALHTLAPPGTSTEQFMANLDKVPLLFADKKKLLFLDTWPIPMPFQDATRSLPSVYHATVQDPLNAYHILNNDLLILTERTVHYYQKLFKPFPIVFKPSLATTTTPTLQSSATIFSH